MKEYEQIQFLAKKIGFQEFTALQEKAFHADEMYDPLQWVFVVGATSSGKTLIPLLVYFYEFLRKKEAGEPYRLLFAVPYRALAAQKQKEIVEIANSLDLQITVTLSTGEFRNKDIAVMNGETDIAVIIYEKVFLFSSMKSSFLQNYHMLVMDEIGLLRDISRGIKADFILLKAAAAFSLKVVALGTPFYDWSRYVIAEQFFLVQEDERPIKLITYPVYYTKSGVNYVPVECQAVRPHVFAPIHNSVVEMNPKRYTDSVIEDICVYHLEKKHKILIFENNRSEVRLLAQRLYKSLAERGVMKNRWNEGLCKNYILREMAAQDDDELYGVMDTMDYLAFSAGIGYHNADVPASLRLLIEREFLGNEGRLRILCSTETLVYGINSNADVVIIPSMIKQHMEENPPTAGFLLSNEYMNYAGRAGRLDPSLPAENQERVGYVYPFIKSVYQMEDERRKNPKKDQKLLWNELQNAIQNPLRISTRFYTLDKGKVPFYLLSIFPDKAVFSADEILRYIRLLPSECDNDMPDLAWTEDILSMLLERKLICVENDDEDEDEDYVTEYALTDDGKNLSGYIISISDYDMLMTAACKCITASDMYKGDLLLGILNSIEVREYVSQNVSPLTDYYPQAIDKTVRRMDCIIKRMNRGIFSKDQYGSIEKDIKRYKQQIKLRQYKKLAGYRRFQRQRLLFALLSWGDGNCTIRQLYDFFSVNYTQMKRFTETISYRLDIVRLGLPAAKARGMLDCEIDLARFREAQAWLKEMADELFYRVPAFICRFLDIHCTDPLEAQKLRMVVKTYTDLLRMQDQEDAEAQKNEKKLQEIRIQIESWKNDRWKQAFYDRFGGILYGEAN